MTSKPSSKSPRISQETMRQQIIETALAMSRSGLSPGRSGNVSSRWKSGMLITPSGMAYEDITPSDIVFVDGDGSVGATPGIATTVRRLLGGSRRAATTKIPSSEWRFHLAAYDVQPQKHAIVHSHSMHATILACSHMPIPAFHYMVAVAGGTSIPLVPYATFGTQELSDHVRAGLKDHTACLMANHGQIAMGDSPKLALELANEIEELAEQYYKVALLGRPHILGEDEMSAVLAKFAGYGQP